MTRNPEDSSMDGMRHIQHDMRMYCQCDQCTDATFKNNWRSAQFMAYQNTNSGGNPIDDKSYFRKCDFIYNDDALNGSHLYAHISQWATRGVV